MSHIMNAVFRVKPNLSVPTQIMNIQNNIFPQGILCRQGQANSAWLWLHCVYLPSDAGIESPLILQSMSDIPIFNVKDGIFFLCIKHGFSHVYRKAVKGVMWRFNVLALIWSLKGVRSCHLRNFTLPPNLLFALLTFCLLSKTVLTGWHSWNAGTLTFSWQTRFFWSSNSTKSTIYRSICAKYFIWFLNSHRRSVSECNSMFDISHFFFASRFFLASRFNMFSKFSPVHKRRQKQAVFSLPPILIKRLLTVHWNSHSFIVGSWEVLGKGTAIGQRNGNWCFILQPKIVLKKNSPPILHFRLVTLPQYLKICEKSKPVVINQINQISQCTSTRFEGGQCSVRIVHLNAHPKCLFLRADFLYFVFENVQFIHTPMFF